jgi:CO/xanthine dehydrogenase Mo-binding subunit
MSLYEKEFSRSRFVKTGGAMIVAFSAVGAFSKAGKANAAGVAKTATDVVRTMSPGGSPFDSYGPPDANQADSFVQIFADNTAAIKTGRVELGQGSTNGLLQIAAEELDMDFDQLQFVRHDTNVTPNTGITAGSSSISKAGPQVRAACAYAKQALLNLASNNLGVPVSSLTVASGVVSGGGKSITYGQLIGNQLLQVTMPAGSLAAGVAPAKPVGDYKLVGIARIPRVDIPAKVTGTYTYVHNIHVPGMLHGRLVRPRGQGAYGLGSATQIVSVDESSIKRFPGARVVRSGDFLGVVAPKEYHAIQAAATLKVKYAKPPTISSSGDLWEQMRVFDSAGQAPARIQASTGNVDNALASAVHTVSQTYKYHYNGHMSIGPTCAVADVTANGALIMSNTQDAYTQRTKIQAALAAVGLNLPLNKVRVQYYEGSSTYGNSPGRFDGGIAAAVMSQLAGAPVRLQFMRYDEHGWDNYGPAQMVDLKGGVDANGNIVALDYTGFQIPAMSTDPTSQHVGIPVDTSATGSADTTNSGTQYNIPNRRVTGKSLPLANNYFKTSTLRAPQAPQTCFASEQLIDELAYAAKMDPYLFRLQNITSAQVNDGHDQWKDVLVDVADLSGWKNATRVANSIEQTGNIRTGRGIALGSYGGSQAGVVAEISVNMATGKIAVGHAYSSQVSGMTVAPEQSENQMVGNMVMGSSRALLEEVVFNTERTTSLDWVSYPILRFKDSPRVTYRIVQRTDLASTGAGEPPMAPIAAAIANAFFDATGVRLREAPMTPARVRATLKAAGK